MPKKSDFGEPTTLSKPLRNMRNQHLRSILGFQKDEDFSVVMYDHKQLGKVLVVSEKGLTMTGQMQKVLLEFQQKEGLQKNGNMGRQDCDIVGISFHHFVADNPLFVHYDVKGKWMAGFPKEQKFFKESFASHLVNTMERKKEPGTEPSDGPAFVFDLTTPYNVDLEQGFVDVFVVVAHDKEKALSTYKKITGLVELKS